jgi:hypothetical protein
MAAFRDNTTGLCDFQNELYLGGVEIWLSELDEEGRIQGFRCMGCAEEFTLTIDETKLEVDKACTGIRETTELVTKTKLSVKFTVQNTTLQNLAEFLAGDVTSYTNAAVAGVDDIIQVDIVSAGGTGAEEGQTILLVDGDGNRIVDIDVDDLTVERSADGSMWVALDEDDDFTVDEKAGTIYLVPGGDVTSGDAIRISLDANMGAQASVKGTNALSGGRRFVAIRALASNGFKDEAKAEVLLYAVFLAADGDLSLSGTEIMKTGFNGTLATSTYYGVPLWLANLPEEA